MHAPPGVTVILGANGAGKSTLLRVLAGLAHPATGVVRLGGLDVHTMPVKRRAQRIAYIAQQPSVAAALTVREVVALSRVVIGRADRAVDRAIERASLRERADDPFHTLSAGQQQRVMLARAIAQISGENEPQRGPRVLLADEPISALDPRHAAEATEILRDVAREASVVIVVHDPTLARRVADHAVLLSPDGTLLAEGEPGRVITPDHLERIYGVAFDEIGVGAAGTGGGAGKGGGGGVLLPRLSTRV